MESWKLYFPHSCAMRALSMKILLLSLPSPPHPKPCPTGKFWFHPLGAVGPWASLLTPLHLNFLSCTTEIKQYPSYHYNNSMVASMCSTYSSAWPGSCKLLWLWLLLVLSQDKRPLFSVLIHFNTLQSMEHCLLTSPFPPKCCFLALWLTPSPSHA